ncbi:hypothetical protein [Microvirga antarctica]|uniref:hypothetical protein n=1 Tax=Microvirga antarctica TaxID=2819233 RepID=UPI001B3130AC|nr:hypothetical protein [Microvirga antarctica]
MRMTRIDWILLPFLVGTIALLLVVVFAVAGFLGLGVLGLLVGLMAQRIEIEKDGATSGDMTTSLYAEQFKARQAMSRAERAEHHAQSDRLLAYLGVAKIISAGMVILGFGFFVLFQL